MNFHAVRAIYQFELARTWRTLFQSIATPVMTTSLYFVVFGSAIGSRMMSIEGVSYGAFIVPGLIMLTVLMESVSNGSFGIYMPKFAGTIYELLSAPVGLTETLLGYTGAARRAIDQRVRPARGWRRDPDNGTAVRPFFNRTSILDGRIPGAHVGHVRTARIPDRHLG